MTGKRFDEAHGTCDADGGPMSTILAQVAVIIRSP
jgi:hypothetical protein